MNINIIKARYHIAVMKLVNDMAEHGMVSEKMCNRVFQKHALPGLRYLHIASEQIFGREEL